MSVRAIFGLLFVSEKAEKCDLVSKTPIFYVNLHHIYIIVILIYVNTLKNHLEYSSIITSEKTQLL